MVTWAATQRGGEDDRFKAGLMSPEEEYAYKLKVAQGQETTQVEEEAEAEKIRVEAEQAGQARAEATAAFSRQSQIPPAEQAYFDARGKWRTGYTPPGEPEPYLPSVWDKQAPAAPMDWPPAAPVPGAEHQTSADQFSQDRATAAAHIERLEQQFGEGAAPYDKKMTLEPGVKVPKELAPSYPQAPTPLYAGTRDGKLEITSPFMTSAGRADEKVHEGIDLAGAEGTPISAPVSGTAVPGYDQYNGNYLVIRADDGTNHTFAHLQSHVSESHKIRYGQKITKGTEFGLLGNTGSSRGKHLHWEVTRAGTKAGEPGRVNVNPLLYLTPDQYTYRNEGQAAPHPSFEGYGVNPQALSVATTAPVSAGVTPEKMPENINDLLKKIYQPGMRQEEFLMAASEKLGTLAQEHDVYSSKIQDQAQYEAEGIFQESQSLASRREQLQLGLQQAEADSHKAKKLAAEVDVARAGEVQADAARRTKEIETEMDASLTQLAAMNVDPWRMFGFYDDKGEFNGAKAAFTVGAAGLLIANAWGTFGTRKGRKGQIPFIAFNMISKAIETDLSGQASALRGKATAINAQSTAIGNINAAARNQIAASHGAAVAAYNLAAAEIEESRYRASDIGVIFERKDIGVADFGPNLPEDQRETEPRHPEEAKRMVASMLRRKALEQQQKAHNALAKGQLDIIHEQVPIAKALDAKALERQKLAIRGYISLLKKGKGETLEEGMAKLPKDDKTAIIQQRTVIAQLKTLREIVVKYRHDKDPVFKTVSKFMAEAGMTTGKDGRPKKNIIQALPASFTGQRLQDYATIAWTKEWLGPMIKKMTEVGPLNLAESEEGKFVIPMTDTDENALQKMDTIIARMELTIDTRMMFATPKQKAVFREILGDAAANPNPEVYRQTIRTMKEELSKTAPSEALPPNPAAQAPSPQDILSRAEPLIR